MSQQDVNTENLYTIDLICHGVGSPGLWNVCIDQRRHSKEIRAIRFRVKSRYDKSSFKLKINYADNSCELLNGQEDIFFSGFLSNYSLRRSCYKCNYANEHRIGDITLGDCATAIDYEETDFKPYEAVSTVLINSEKGKRLWDKSQDMVEYQLLDLKKEKGQNHQLSHATVYPIERDHYFQDEAVSAILSRKSVSLKQRLPLATYMRLYIAGCMTIRTRYKIKRISKQIKKLMIRS